MSEIIDESISKPKPISKQKQKDRRYCQKCSNVNKYFVPIFYRCTVCRVWLCLECSYNGYYMTLCIKHKIEKENARNFRNYSMEHYLVCNSQLCVDQFESGIGNNRYMILLEANAKLKKRCDFMMAYVERDFS